LALIDHARFSGAPDMPSITEFIPAYRMPSSWNGLLGPAGLPEPIVQRINAEAGKALNTPDVKSKLEGTGDRIVGKTPAEFAQRIADDIEFFGRLIRSVGIQPE
jgi:tripartite-type tricarboxylate transporter receptor subunit TctC